MKIEANIGGQDRQIELPDGTTPAQISSVLKHAKSQFDTPKADADQTEGIVPEGKRLDRFIDATKNTAINDLQDIHQGIGIAGRALARGATAIPTALINIPSASANALRWVGDKALGVDASSGSVPYLDPMGEALNQPLIKKILPPPSGWVGRIAEDVIEPLASTGGAIKAGEKALAEGSKFITPKIAKFLSASPEAQLTAAGLSGAAGGSTRELGGSPTAQTIASLAGGFAPTSSETYLKNLMRGDAANKDIVRNIRNFKTAGTTPTVGQATESNFARSLEGIAAKMPGGAGVMGKKAAQQAEDISNKAESIISAGRTKTDPTEMGQRITEGVKEEFIPHTREVQGKLYDKIDNFINPQQEIPIHNFQRTVDVMNAPIKGAEKISETTLFVNKTIDDLKRKLKEQTAGTPATKSPILNAEGKPYQTPGIAGKETLPYGSIKELRTRIGEKLSSTDLSPDISKQELKRLYGSLSEDMKSAVKSAGPDAERAFNKANEYTRNLHNRIDLLNNVVGKSGGYEKVYNAAVSGTKDGATTLNAVMKALPPQERQMLSSSILLKLGKPTASIESSVEQGFDTNKFLTNWKNLDDRAKNSIMGSQTKQFDRDINRILEVQANVRRSPEMFSKVNPNTDMKSFLKTLGGLGADLATGLVGFATNSAYMTGISEVGAGAMAASNVTARAMTNPNFVRWLVSNGDKPISALPAVVNELSIDAERRNDDDLKDIAERLKSQIPEPQPLKVTIRPQPNPLSAEGYLNNAGKK